MACFCCASRIIADGKYLSAMSQPNFNLKYRYSSICISKLFGLFKKESSVQNNLSKHFCLSDRCKSRSLSNIISEKGKDFHCVRDKSMLIYFHQHLLCKFEKDVKCMINALCGVLWPVYTSECQTSGLFCIVVSRIFLSWNLPRN